MTTSSRREAPWTPSGGPSPSRAGSRKRRCGCRCAISAATLSSSSCSSPSDSRERTRASPVCGEACKARRGAPCPRLAALTAWWAEPPHRSATRAPLRRRLDIGLLETVNPDAPRGDWALQVPPLVWDAARGELDGPLADRAAYRPPESLPPTTSLIVSPETERAVAGLPGLLAAGDMRAFVVRGPNASGR